MYIIYSSLLCIVPSFLLNVIYINNITISMALDDKVRRVFNIIYIIFILYTMYQLYHCTSHYTIVLCRGKRRKLKYQTEKNMMETTENMGRYFLYILCTNIFIFCTKILYLPEEKYWRKRN